MPVPGLEPRSSCVRIWPHRHARNFSNENEVCVCFDIAQPTNLKRFGNTKADCHNLIIIVTCIQCSFVKTINGEIKDVYGCVVAKKLNI